MNHLHLQETARHYANLAEQYRSQLAEEQELNEDLLGLVDALCEELGIDVEALLENDDPIGRFSSASKGASSSSASSSTPDTSERKRKIQDQMAVIKHRMEYGTEKERDYNTDEYYYLEKRLNELKKELQGLS